MQLSALHIHEIIALTGNDTNLVSQVVNHFHLLPVSPLFRKMSKTHQIYEAVIAPVCVLLISLAVELGLISPPQQFNRRT